MNGYQWEMATSMVRRSTLRAQEESNALVTAEVSHPPELTYGKIHLSDIWLVVIIFIT